MNATKDKIARIDEILKKAEAPILKYFRPGLGRLEVINFLDKLGIYPNESLIALYEWHNGINFPPDGIKLSKVELLPDGCLFSLKDLEEKRKELIDWEIVDNPEQLVPFAGTFEGEMYLLKNDSKGQVFYLHPAINTYGDLYFDSIDSMLELIIECYEKAIFTISRSSGLVVEMDEYRELIKTYR